MAYGYPSVEQMTQDIIDGARARGIDPSIAVRAAQSEGLKPGVWQSNYYYKSGARERSYSPWQLNIDSPKALGSRFRSDTGLDPSDPANWKAINNYALDRIKSAGWGDWFGPQKIGIKGMMGVNNSPYKPMMLGPSDTTPESPTTMPTIQPSFPALDPNNLVDPRKLTPIQMAMMKAQGGTLMGPGSTPGLGDPNPQTLAAGQADMPQGLTQGYGPPINMPQPSPAPQASPSLLGPSGPSGASGAMSADASQPPQVPKPGYDWGNALIGAGAGLLAIDNPGGAAAAIAMLKDRKKLAGDYGVIQGKDGSMYRYDKNTGAVEKLSQGTGQDDAFTKEEQKKAAQELAKTDVSIQQGADRISKLDQLNKYFENPKVYQGAAGSLVATAKSFAKALGADPSTYEGLDDSQAAKALANQFSLTIRNPSAGEGLPGNLSDKDLAFLRESAPSLDNNPEANKKIIGFMRAIEKRNVEFNKEKAKYLSENHSAIGLAAHMEDWRNSYDSVAPKNFSPKTDTGATNYMDFFGLR